MLDSNKIERGLPGTSPCPEVGAIYDYAKYYLKLIPNQDNVRLSDSLLFGLGCGLAFNFEHLNGNINVSCINNLFIKDLLAHLNIKAWYKTEPDSAKFINYIGDLLLKSQPIITYTAKSSGSFYEYRPILLYSCNAEKTLFTGYDYFSNNQVTINEDALKKACDFSFINTSFTNFWFDIALPEKIFPLEHCIRWAITKNAQSMLNSSSNSKGLASLKSFSQFLKNIDLYYSKEKALCLVSQIKTAIKRESQTGYANRVQFINFLEESKDILKISEIDNVINDFKKSSSEWEYFYNILFDIENNNQLNISAELAKASKHCESIIEIEDKALFKLSNLIMA